MLDNLIIFCVAIAALAFVELTAITILTIWTIHKHFAYKTKGEN